MSSSFRSLSSRSRSVVAIVVITAYYKGMMMMMMAVVVVVSLSKRKWREAVTFTEPNEQLAPRMNEMRVLNLAPDGPGRAEQVAACDKQQFERNITQLLLPPSQSSIAVITALAPQNAGPR
jgi:hypothetical protein